MSNRTNLTTLRVISVFLVVLAVSATAAGRTIYVDDDGPADFNNIQAAIDDAVDGDTVIVAPGTYTGDGNRDIDFGGKAITVRSIDPCNSDVVAATIIDCQGSKSEPHRGFKFVSSEETDSVLAGLTITNGYAPRDMRWVSTMVWVGGAILCDGSSPTISYCTIANNWSNWSGGGIFCRDSSLTISQCAVIDNTAKLYGGGIFCYRGNPTIAYSKISGNMAKLHSGGGIYCHYDTTPTIRHCVITGNSTGGYAGGVYYRGGNLTIQHCTIASNSADNYTGGGIHCWENCNLLVSHCILWGNTASSGAQISNDGTSSATVSYSDVQGGWPGEGNIDADPCFVDSGYWDDNGTPEDISDNFWVEGDYHLLPGSPCIDAGNPNYPYDPDETDLDGNPRVIGGRIDIGAYEGYYQGFLLSAESVIVPEGGTATFTVALATDPLGTLEVTVAVESGDPDITVESGGLLTFDSTNYTQPQTVTLAAAEDADELHGTTVILVSAPGVYPASVTAYELDSEAPTELYVDCDAGGANDGSSWEDAFTELREPLSFAVGTFFGEIRVAQGVYTPGDREATFQLKNCITIKGGYAGFGEPDPNARDIEVYETVLSGDIGIPGDNSDNSYHVVTGSGTDATAVLDGFTITAGNANQDYPSPYANGGGMYNYTGSPTVSNCTFSGNSAMHYGGGMFNGESSPTVTNCIFSGNSADYGSGMYNYQSSPTVTNCTFSGNSAETGGGMCNWENSSPTVTNCTFGGNSAMTYGGGMSNFDHSSPTVTNCVFSGNSAANYGHGGGMSNFDNSSPTVTNCTFSGNSAGWDGGGMFNYYSSPTLANCILWGNAAPSGPQIHNYGTSSATVSYSDVVGGWPGEGNIDADPRFGTPGAWEPIEETDMVSYWKFDGNADDSAGDNDGTVYGAQWTIGQLGGALDFDGDGDYVDCGNDSSLNPTNNFSISTWFNLKDAGPVLLLCKGNVPAYFPGGAYTIICVPSNGTLSFYVRGSNNTELGYATTAIPLNEWTHIVGTFSDGNISIYKNGAFVEGGVLGTPTINSNNGPLGIGAEGDGGTPFNGIIDDVAIHNRALSSEKIEQLYQIGLSGRSDYHLLPDSPCINAGDPNYAAGPNETDLDGKPRVIGGRIDMGAYEYPNTTPVACIVGGDRIVEAKGPFGARVTLDGSSSSDADSAPGTNDDIARFDWYKVDACDPNFEDFIGSGEIIDCNLPLGEHIIVLEVTDKAGAFDTNEVTIIVQDTTPPDFTLSATPTMLWPANHKMVLITPTWTASDICDASPEVSLVSITMNEDDEVTGDGNTTNDIQIDDDGSIYLRAERSGAGSSRIYTITYQVVDDSGNVTVARATVTVPHDQR